MSSPEDTILTEILHAVMAEFWEKYTISGKESAVLEGLTAAYWAGYGNALEERCSARKS